MTNSIFDKLVTVVVLAVIGISLVTLSWIAKEDAAYEELELIDYCYNVSVWEADQKVGIGEFDRRGHPNFNRIDCELNHE